MIVKSLLRSSSSESACSELSNRCAPRHLRSCTIHSPAAIGIGPATPSGNDRSTLAKDFSGTRSTPAIVSNQVMGAVDTFCWPVIACRSQTDFSGQQVTRLQQLILQANPCRLRSPNLLRLEYRETNERRRARL
jgi:hypothetical protein